MVQDQLIEYVSSQVKLGVSRESIKAALVGAGWAAADVDDTIKKVDGGNKPAAAAGAVTASAATAAPGGASPVGGMAKSAEPRAIRVSDLVSGSAASPMASPTSGASSPFFKSSQKSVDLAAPARASTSPAGMKMTIVWIVVVVLLLGLSGYLYFQNSSLSSKVSSLGGQSTDVTSQLSTLNTQVQALTASNTALMAQAQTLSAQNMDLMDQLSFVAIPVSATGSTATSSITVSGTLTGGKSSFALTTAYGIVIYVANAKTASVNAALTPLIGSTTTVQLTGIHAAGSQDLTVTAVNGSSTTP